MKNLDCVQVHRHDKSLNVWLDHLRQGTLDQTKEVSLHGGFLERIFGDVLGYSTMAMAQEGRWELVAEKGLLSGAADGAIGFFSKGNSHVVAPIELKGAAQFLEHAKGRALTPIQQGWDYANKAPESRWIIISNYRETRLYAKSRGQGAYELFLLEDLATESGVLRFIALLGRDALLGGPTPEQSPLTEMLLASERTEQEITAKLYGHYRGIRARLFDELLRKHSNIPAEELLAHAQTILDRVLFLAFAEDRGLVPHETLAQAYEHHDPYNPRPIWQNFVAVFSSVDKGNPGLGIPAYNGGLFRKRVEIEELELSDEMCEAFKELGEYDFSEDVSVDVLGHIFEQSITDLEKLRAEAAAQADQGVRGIAVSTGKQKAPSRRQKEGIFYTPPFVTAFLVRETLGHAIADAWARASEGRAATKKDKIATWEAYQNELRQIRVLDPACGSGAFLIAAFDALAQQFDRANRVLAELRGQQTSLFDLTKTLLNENLFGIDKSGESVEITKLSLWLQTAERGKRLTFIDRNIRQGNSVVSDPLVDPWAFDWAAGRVARSFLEPEPPVEEDVDAIDARWRDGFDVVLGNPPYVRHELLTVYKEHWQDEFRTFDGLADLFVYFFDRGLQQLKPGGRLGFIVSNKWLRGGYAERLRALFSNECTVETIVDFGHAPVFPDADAFPCIITLRKITPEPKHAVRVTLYPREELGKELLASYVDAHRFPLPQHTLADEGWTLEPPGVRTLLEKLQNNGVQLSEYASAKPYYGIKTGCNKAFLVDETTKERMCREDPRSSEILKRYMRGRDIERWSPKWAGLWMIYVRWDLDIEKYPAIYSHLLSHRSALEGRAEVKQGRFPWYALSRYASDYVHIFDQPKLLYPDILWRADFCVAPSGIYTNNTTYLIPSADKWLLACLNSPAMWSYLWRTAQHGKDEALRMFGKYVVTIPIAKPAPQHLETVEDHVDRVSALSQQLQGMHEALLDLLKIEYDVERPGRKLADFAAHGSDEFVREVKKRRPKKGARLSVTGLRELRSLYDAEAPKIVNMRSQVLLHERSIAEAVHAAYGLDQEDLDLLRATQPPRMPPGW